MARGKKGRQSKEFDEEDVAANKEKEMTSIRTTLRRQFTCTFNSLNDHLTAGSSRSFVEALFKKLVKFLSEMEDVNQKLLLEASKEETKKQTDLQIKYLGQSVAAEEAVKNFLRSRSGDDDTQYVVEEIDPDEEFTKKVNAAKAKLADANEAAREATERQAKAVREAYEAQKELDELVIGSSDRKSKSSREEEQERDNQSLSSASQLNPKNIVNSTTVSQSSISAPDDWIDDYRNGQVGLPQKKSSGRSNVKTSIKRFSGIVLEWFPFIDQYKALVHDSGKEPSELFAILMELLEGECRDHCYGSGGGEAGYKEALYRLKRRYGRRDVLRVAHHRELDKLDPKRGEGSSSSQFQRFAERVRIHLFELNRIGDSSNVQIIDKLCSKLALADRLEWNSGKRGDLETRSIMEFGEWLCDRAAVYINPYAIAAEQTGDRQRSFNNNGSNFQKKHSRTYSTSSYSEKSGEKKDSKEQRTAKTPYCFKCKTEGHRLADYAEFKKMTAQERYKFVLKGSLCFCCFAPRHQNGTRDCKWKKPCSISGCKLNHHVLLHEERKSSTTAAAVVEESSDAESNNTNCGKSEIAFGVTQVEVLAADGVVIPATVFFDEGSDTTLFREGFIRRLKLKGVKQKLSVAGVGQQKTSYDSEKVSVTALLPKDRKISSCFSNSVCLSGSTMPNLTKPVPVRDWSKLKFQWKHLSDLDLKASGGEIDILIGQDHRHLTVAVDHRQGTEGQPVAEKNSFGWVVSGVIGEQTDTMVARIHSVFASNEPVSDEVNEALVEQVKRFNDTEDFGSEFKVEQVLSSEEDAAEKSLDSSTLKLEVGYQVNLLWRPGEPNFKSNYRQALYRFENLIRRFQRESSTNFERDYRKAMKKYEENGYARPVLNWKEGEEEFFLPHHGVYKNLKDQENGKIRVVFDAASQSRSRSSISGKKCLNDGLYSGPSIVASLTSVFLRFCQKEIAWSADVGAHFSRVRLPDRDSKFLRFIWMADESEEPKVFEMTRLPFGLNCSPFVAVSTTRRAVRDSGADEAVVRAVEENMYIDDYVHSSSTIDDAVKEAAGVNAALQFGDFHLEGWVSNSPEFLKKMKIENLDPEKILVKILGILWDSRKDTLSYRFDALDTVSFTHAGLLSKVASVFDPLGRAAPLTVKAKAKLRELSLRGLKWKEVVTGEERQWWEQWLQKVKELESFESPRCLFPNEENIQETVLVGFGDASEEAFAAAVYLRHFYKDGSIQVRFVKAATKLAPKNRVSIPRLELNAALLTARLTRDVGEQLSVKKIDRRLLFTDSSTVRNWLRAPAADYKTYTGNRIGMIQLETKQEEWRFVPGKLNPADLATRSVIMDGPALPPLWNEGAEFLKSTEEKWPKDLPWVKVTEELKKVKVHQVTVKEKTDWSKVEVSVEDLVKFNQPNSKLLNLIKICQEEEFAVDFERLKKKKNLRTDSQLLSLAPFISEDGLLRLGGRSGKAKLPYEVLHPPILPGSHLLAEKIARACHEKFIHSGTDFVLAQLRQIVWVTKGRSVVKKVRLSCLKCAKERARPGVQFMADLPSARLDYESPAFNQTSVDLFGPLEVSTSRNRTVKRWGVVFKCLAVGAVYVAPVETISSEDFLLVLRQFVGIYGKPKKLWLDNGTNFI